MGIHNGPLFRDPKGQPLRASAMEDAFFNRLEQTQMNRPDLIPQDLIVSEEFGIYRSFCRGATSEAVNHLSSSPTIDGVRWKEQAASRSV
jgi:hypothetical protein